MQLKKNCVHECNGSYDSCYLPSTQSTQFSTSLTGLTLKSIQKAFKSANGTRLNCSALQCDTVLITYAFKNKICAKGNMYQLIYVQVDCTGIISVKICKINKFLSWTSAHSLLERWEMYFRNDYCPSQCNDKKQKPLQTAAPKLLEDIELSTINQNEKIVFRRKKHTNQQE